MLRQRISSTSVLLAVLGIACLSVLGARAGCLITEDSVSNTTFTRCPCFPNTTDVTQYCRVVEHQPATGSGIVSCHLQPTCFEQCPGVSCRLSWLVNRTADGQHRVVVISTREVHCSSYPRHQVSGVEVLDCNNLTKIVTLCDDSVEFRDGRTILGKNFRHSCTCFGENCTSSFEGEITVNVVKADSSSIALPVAVGIGGVLGMLVGVLIAIIANRYSRNRKRRTYDKASQGSFEKADLLAYGSPSPVQLQQTIARGRFGIVWRGLGQDKESLAVKVTNEKNKDSWINECQLLSKTYMRHPSIVRFHFGEERVSSHNVKEYWLVMELCELGSLCGYLKNHKLAWNECVDLMSSLTAGVEFLHVDNGVYKPEIAHRDLKSSNVLVKLQPQVRCVLADFGLAADLSPCADTNSLLHQAGTPRYMSPECLASCINFKDESAFLKVDVYSLGLLLWEISACCTDFVYEGQVGGHELPYWKQVGDQPSIRSMQEVVINQRLRPTLPKGWEAAMTTVKELRSLADLLEDAWAGDPEVRVFAPAIMIQMRKLREQKVQTESAIQPAMQAAATASEKEQSVDIPPDYEPSLPTGRPSIGVGESTVGTLPDDEEEEDDAPPIVMTVGMTTSGVGTFDSALETVGSTEDSEMVYRPALVQDGKTALKQTDSDIGYLTGSEQL